MRKFHWISMFLLAAPFAFVNACGGDDTAPATTPVSSGGSSGAGGAGTGGTTGGSSGSATSTGGFGGTASTGGSAGSGGSGTGGTAGSATPDAGGGGTASVTSDAATEASGGDDGSSTKCTTANDPGLGKSCKDLCDGYFKNCKAHAATSAKYADQAACVTDCKTLAQPALCCRANHSVTLSNNANPSADDLNTHCPHIIGTMLCP